MTDPGGLPYVYRVVEVVRVVDGDTVDLTVDLGFHLRATLRFRLLGVNAPELRTEAGPVAKAFVSKWFAEHGDLRVRTEKADSFGRWLGWVEPVDGSGSLSEALLVAGLAVPFR